MTLEEVRREANMHWRRGASYMVAFAERVHRDGFKRGQEFERSRKPEPIKISIRVTLPVNLGEFSLSGSVHI